MNIFFDILKSQNQGQWITLETRNKLCVPFEGLGKCYNADCEFAHKQEKMDDGEALDLANSLMPAVDELAKKG